MSFRWIPRKSSTRCALLLVFILPNDQMPDHIVADPEDPIQLQRDVGIGLEVHENVHAFAPAVDLIGQPAAPLFPLARLADRAAVVGHDLLILLDDGLELLVGQLRVYDVHRLVVAHMSPPLGLWLRSTPERGVCEQNYSPFVRTIIPYRY